MKIPFHVPFYDAADEEAIVSSFRTHQLVGDGPRTAEASRQLASLLGVRHVLLTTSCTHALELAVMTLRLKAGDEVIVPSFTFVSTTNCILRQGAHIVFADIAPETLTVSSRECERRITARTKAIIPVVYAGISPDVDAILSVARPGGIVVIEDAAQAVGATYRSRPAGTTGDIGCYSFHETKNYSTGEGGAFATSNADYASLAEIIREKGTNRKQFLQGLIDKYTWVDTGSSFLPPDHTGALLLTQLSKMDFIQRRREEIHRHYVEEFKELALKGLLTLPTIPEFVHSNYHIFYVLMTDETTRNDAIAFFHSRNIGTTFHYLPLHLSPVGQRLGYRAGDFPVTESVSGRLLRLPIYPSLTADQQDKVIHTMREFFRQ
jgi:dTDP-4-amino-4,6-dideoxygalactose transaminase